MSQKVVDARSVGVIGKPHGIKGEVNVMLLTDYPDSILAGAVLFLDESCTCDVMIESIFLKKSRKGNSAVIKFRGISNRDEAAAIRGKELFRNPGDSPELEEGEFWVDDIEGCNVYLPDLTRLGTVEKVEVLPANENLLVRPVEGGDHMVIPLVDEYIDRIDIRDKKVVIKKMPEYL